MSERPGMNALRTGKIMFMELDRKHHLRSQFCCFFVVVVVVVVVVYLLLRELKVGRR